MIRSYLFLDLLQRLTLWETLALTVLPAVIVVGILAIIRHNTSEK